MKDHLSFRERFKVFIERRGIFAKRIRSVPFGASLWIDLPRIGFEAKENMNVIDVGANIGAWSGALLLRWPSAIVHAFEPAPLTFDALERRLGNLPNVILNRAAVGSHDGPAEMFIFDNNLVSSLYPHAEEGVNFKESVVVKVIKLDDYIAERRIEGVDLLKIDAEGGDIEVLKGASKSLAGGLIKLVHIECAFHHVTRPLSTFQEIYALLVEKGYRIITIYTEYADRKVGFKFGSALFAHTTLQAAKDE